ncbi:MFS transporter [Nibricoccus aquaticus]|uniref:MFS transporter n=2 Tax=Nibricoccus aquaticus TaxID=2576891 RepID=A0A290Q2K6_9BACT|nr:MFS transporter [Nibricoccus aquaticus]
MHVLVALSFSHLLNDIIQALLPSIYPLLKDSYDLSFTQIGFLTFTTQVTASLLQPVVGVYTDKRPLPYSLPIGMSITLIGLVLLSLAGSFSMLLIASALVGLGSAIFHPEASRLARMASGGRHGFAQSLFQVGGNLGTSLGPLAAAFVVMPRGQIHMLWFTALALLGIVLLHRVGSWYQQRLTSAKQRATTSLSHRSAWPRRTVIQAIAVLIVLVFSKYVYLTSLTSYYTFYLIEKFQLTASQAQIYLFVFLFAVAAGTIIGGPVGDHFGRKWVIWISILGVAPFALWMPHTNLAGTVTLSVVIGVVLASAFSAILVYAQELVPGKVGLISGLFFGFAFGVAGIGSVALGKLADHTSIEHVFDVCSYLPLIGLLTVFLPDIERRRT